MILKYITTLNIKLIYDTTIEISAYHDLPEIVLEGWSLYAIYEDEEIEIKLSDLFIIKEQYHTVKNKENKDIIVRILII